jgi:hypothetical protein
MLSFDARQSIAARVRRLACDGAREVAAIVPVRGANFGSPLVISVGEATHVDVDPTSALRPAITSRADSWVLVHTHPCGRPPSNADLAVTRRLVAAGRLIGVPLLGHLVVTPPGWYDCCAARPLEPNAHVADRLLRGAEGLDHLNDT